MFEQLRDLRDQYGFDVFAVVSAAEGALVDKLRSENIPYYVADFRSGSGSPQALLRSPLAILKLARFLRRERFDIVQTHIFATTLIGRPAAWLAGVPVRLAMIAGPFHLEAYTSRWIERATCWMETMLIPACEKSRQLCLELGMQEDRLALIYYSADETRFDPKKTSPLNSRQKYGWPEDTPLVCMVALFYPRLPKSSWVPVEISERGHKGHGDLVEAAPIILSEFPHAKFLLVGSGWGVGGEKYLEEIKSMVHRMGLQESVIFTGFSPDPNRVLHEASVAVQASLTENLGGTIEALLMGCPMVATRVGGMPDSVRDGETGVLVNPSDPSDLARGIMELLRDPERARALGNAGRRLMLERFTLDRTVSDLAELYDRLLTREQELRKSYSLWVSLWRLLLAVPVFAYLAFRLLVLDVLLPIYLPIYLARLRSMLLRAAYTPFRVYHRVRFYASRTFGVAGRFLFRRPGSATLGLEKSGDLDDFDPE